MIPLLSMDCAVIPITACMNTLECRVVSLLPRFLTMPMRCCAFAILKVVSLCLKKLMSSMCQGTYLHTFDTYAHIYVYMQEELIIVHERTCHVVKIPCFDVIQCCCLMHNSSRRQELCESRGGRPGLPIPNSPKGLCGRKTTLKRIIVAE